MARLVPTLALARAAGRDAGNASMRRAGRKAWNVDDFEAATDVLIRLHALINAVDPEAWEA